MSSWLAEDPELLEAALEIVGEWDVGYLPGREPVATTLSDNGTDGVARSTNSSGSSSPKVPTKPTQHRTSASTARQRRRLQASTMNSTHHRRREEIRLLTRQATELERQLQTLVHATQAAQEGIIAETDRARASMWRDIAERQRQFRMASEADQAKLRGRVDAHVAVVRGLVKLIQKARRLEDEDTERAFKRPRFVPRGVFHMQHSDQLLAIEELYGSIDRFYAHPKFRDGSMKFVDVKVHEARPREFVLELCEAWTVPFDEDNVLEALWKFSIRRQTAALCAPEYQLDADVHIDDAELVSQFTALTNIGTAQGNFDGRAIVKRFPTTETSPPAIITTVCFTPSQATPGDFEGVGNQSLSCIRVLPATSGEPDKRASRVTFTERFSITFDEDASGWHHATSYTNMTLEKLKNNMNAMHETMETLLLALGH